MNGLGQQVFAGAGFALNHDRDVSARHLAQLLNHHGHLWVPRVQVLQGREVALAAGHHRVRLGAGRALGWGGGHIGVGGHARARAPAGLRLELHPAPHRHAVVQHGLHGFVQAFACLVNQGRHGHAKQRRKRVGLKRAAGQPQLKLRAAVGRQKTALGGKHRNALHQRAQKLGAGVEMDAHRVLEHVGKHVVFNHLRRHAHQCQGVVVVALVVARHVQRPDDLALGVKNGGARTRQKLVGRQKVLLAVHGQRFLFVQRGADGVGAFLFFRPVHTGHQGHAGGFFQKIGVAQRVQHHAARRGQQHHAVGVHDLVVQRFHHGGGVLEQKLALLAHRVHFAFAGRAVVGLETRVQPMLARAAVRLDDGGRGRQCGSHLPAPGCGVAERCVLKGCAHVVSRLWDRAAPFIHVPWCVESFGWLSGLSVVRRWVHAILFVTVPRINTCLGVEHRPLRGLCQGG